MMRFYSNNIIFKHFTIMLFTVFVFCKGYSQTQDSIPAYQSFTIASQQVGETRTINVWMPTGYATSNDSLAVLYMADGGIKEDFPHIANTISELIASKSIKPILLVGIENTQRRKDLTGPTEVEKDKKIAPVVGEAEKFRAFIKEELFPEINKRYRITHEKGIIGESLAGLFVVETFLVKSEMFDYYIAMDPSLWWNNHALVKTANNYLLKFPAAEKRLWFAGSGAKDISTYTQQFAKILESKNLSTLKWKYCDEPKEKHNTIFRATKEKALKWALPVINP